MSTVIWRIFDDKAGHANQTRGLIKALAAITSVQTCDLRAPSRKRSLRWWLTGQFPLGKNLPRPNLILGAGHSTHFAMLAARHRYGGKAVVLMNPTLPRWLFDLCIVPQHDGLVEAGNVVLTHGVLNVVAPSLEQEAERGLILIGGPSAACGWNSRAMVEKIATVVSHQPEIAWKLSTARRTPPDFLKLLVTHSLPNLTVFPHDRTCSGWVPTELAHSAHVWVSEDSVSMVYEALTSGARVGLLEVPHKHRGRVAQGVEHLSEMSWITRFADWDRSRPVTAPAMSLHEAKRCAALLCERFQLPQAASPQFRTFDRVSSGWFAPAGSRSGGRWNPIAGVLHSLLSSSHPRPARVR